MSDVTTAVSEQLDQHFSGYHRDEAQITFLGNEPMRLLRFVPDSGSGDDDVVWYSSLGCSAHPMDPEAINPDPGAPRAEIVLGVRRGIDSVGKTLAIIAASPSVEGVVLREGLLIDLESPLWPGSSFTAVILTPSPVPDVAGDWGADVVVYQAVPVTQTEAAWVRLKSADTLREAWTEAGVDILDPDRSAVQPRD